MRVALYARVSSQRQAERQGIEAQLERLQAHCRANGWDAAQELSFRDDGYSGANANRPGLSALMAKATEGAFDVLLLTAPDRLARDYVWQRLLLDEFRSHNCRVEFLERPMDESPHDRLLLEVRGAVAEYERSLITERMKQGRARKYQAGLLLPFSRAPYGYQLDPERPRDPQGLSVDESEAAVVREIFQLYEDAGSTLRDIIRWLEASGVASPTGKPRWSTSAIRALLTNPSYTGRIYVGRWRTRPATTRASALQPVGRRGQSQTPAPADEWILVAEIPALIGADCFEQVQAKLKRNRQFSLRNTQPERYLLRALVSCGGCGLACRCRKVTDRNGYYFCYERQWPASSRWREERCLARYAPAAQLDSLNAIDKNEYVHP